MNQSNNKLSNNKTTSKNTKKWFFILSGGIIALTILLVIIFSVKKASSKPKQNQKENNLTVEISPEDKKNCPYLNEQEMTVLVGKRGSGIRKENLEKLKQIPQDYIIKLWKKGYHCWDIFKLWDWNVEEKETPDLNSPKRIGVINQLFVTYDFDKILGEKKETDLPDDEEDNYIGGTKNLVVIIRKVSSGGQIYIDKGYFNTPTWEEKQSGHYVKRVVNFALRKENINPGQYDIFALSAAGRENLGQEKKIGFGRNHGKSAGSALYLALLSALHQKPLSDQVAATGALSLSTKWKKWGKVNGQEFQIVPGANLPIGGLKHKVLTCAEKRINFLVLSKYQTSPSLLSVWQREGKWRGCWDGENNKLYTKGEWRKPAEDYSKVVPSEIREKLTVFWTKNISELRELLFQGKLS